MNEEEGPVVESVKLGEAELESPIHFDGVFDKIIEAEQEAELESEDITPLSDEEETPTDTSTSVTEPTTETEEETPAEEEEDDSKESDEFTKKYEGYSNAALLAESLKQSGELSGDLEVPKDLDFATLKSTLVNSARNEGMEQVEQYKEARNEALEYAELILQGVDPKQLQRAATHLKFATLEIEGEGEAIEKNRKTLLRAYYQDKGLDQEDADNLISDLITQEKDLSRSKVAAKHFKAKEQAIKDNKRQEQEAYQQQQIAYQQEQNRLYRSTIEKGKIGDVTLDAKGKKRLHDAMFRQTELLSVPQADGSIQKIKVTKAHKLQQDFMQSPEKQLLFLQLLLDDFDTSTFTKKAVEDHNDNILDLLNARTTQKVTTKKKKAKSSNPGDRIDQLIDSRMIG